MRTPFFISMPLFVDEYDDEPDNQANSDVIASPALRDAAISFFQGSAPNI